MKKKIVFSVMGIIIVSSILLTIVSKNTKKTFMQDGVMFAVTLDGVSRDSFPSGNNYYVDINCENARGRWMRMPSTDGGSDDAYRLVIDDVTSNASCNVDFKTNPSTIKDTITGLITSGNIYEHKDGSNNTDWVLEFLPNVSYGDYRSSTKLAKADYENLTMYYTDGSSTSSTYYQAVPTYSGSTAYTNENTPFTYSDSDNTWTLNPDTENRYNHFYFSPKEEGYYQLCYSLGMGAATNILRVYKNTTLQTIKTSATNTGTSLQASTNLVQGEYCTELGNLSTSDYIHISQRAMSPYATLNFSLQKATEGTVNPGYRYEGKKPDNYIWYNNEMWRIIGVVPTCVEYSTETDKCTQTKNLVKIIRAESIGGLRWNTSYSNYVWGGTYSLYQVLNNYYLTKENATGKSICTGTVAADCDYRVKGIGSDSYYGNMIENVYWNTGVGLQSETASVTYGKEVQTQNVNGKIGIMNASDYGYATTTHSNVLSSYDSYAITNWLYGQGYEWTITQHSSGNTAAIVVDANGAMNSYGMTGQGATVRPVLYLKDSVYVVSGDGTESTPYQVAYGS